MRFRLFILAGFVSVLIVSCGWMKELKQPVLQFFDAVQQGDIRGAYDQTSAAFRSSTDFARFEQFLNASGLIRYASGSWPSVSFENNTGTVKGTVTTTDGAVIPLTVHLVRAETRWQIQRLEMEEAGIQVDQGQATRNSQPGIPEMEQLSRMTVDAISRLGDAINSDNYDTFHNWISETWRNQITPDQLRQAFRSFKENNVDITVVRGMTPEFSEPARIGDDGVMEVKGVFNTSPYNTRFELSFYPESGEWRLFGINVQVR